MTKAHEEVASAALALPPEARAELAERLLDSVETLDRSTIDAAWETEIERRIDQLDQGEAKLVPGEALMKELKARYK